MSQQIPVATSSSSSSAAPVPRYRNRHGILSYAQGSIAEFQKLEDIIGKTQWNVYEFVFDFRLEFCQKKQGDKCTVRYLPGGYAKPSLDNKPNGMIEIFFEVTGIPECIFSGDVDKAKDFPLAKLVGSFTHVKIMLAWSEFVPKPGDLHQCRQVLSHLITGSVTQLPESNEAVFLKQMRDVSEAESKAQEKIVGTQKGCHIRTTRWRKTIVIQVWPGANQDNADLQVGTNNFGKRYVIRESNVFAEADAKAHKVPGQEATRWEFNVVDHLEGFEAPLVGIIQNRFKAGKDIDQYDTRTDDDVLLEPIIDDVLGERSREGLSNVRVVELKEKIAAAKSDNADARTRLLEEREREMRKDEEMMRRKAEKFTAALKKLEDEGQSSVGALEDDLRRLQG